MTHVRWLSAVALVLGGALVCAQPPATPGKGNHPNPNNKNNNNQPPVKRSSSNTIKVIVGTFAPIFGYPAPPPLIYGASSFNSSITIVTPPSNPTVVITNPPPQAPQQSEMDLVNPIIFRPRPKPAEADEAPLPGVPAGGFRPVRPEDRMQAQQPAQPEKRGEEKPAPKERRPEPELKPKDEAARQVTLGRKAFANQEYGRATARFQEAIRLNPDDALAYFLLAEADFALGKYREATAAIHDGLRRKADWPTSDFRPIELYGPNVADYAEHLDQLRQALKQNPRDPALLFLYAYQLWFDGRQDEARALFRQALPLVTEPRFLHLFLDAQGGIRVVFR
jgi:tetratricopeptide (TPR) repeat protein